MNLLPYFWSTIQNLLDSFFQYCHPIFLPSFLIFRFSHTELTVIKGRSVCQPCIQLNKTRLVYLKNNMNVRKRNISNVKKCFTSYDDFKVLLEHIYFDILCDWDNHSIYWLLTSSFQNPIEVWVTQHHTWLRTLCPR